MPKFVLLEIGTLEHLRNYDTLEELYNDLKWKAPESFWVGVVEERKAYTIPQIFEKYNKEFKEG